MMTKPERPEGPAVVAVGEELTGRRSTALPTPTPLAFILGGSVQAGLLTPITEARWTEAARSYLRALETYFQARRPRQSLPVVSLRSRLHLADQRAIRLDTRLGLGWDGRTLAWSESAPDQCQDPLNAAVLGWLVDEVAPELPDAPDAPDAQDEHNRQGESPRAAWDTLKALARTSRAIEVVSRANTGLGWGQTLNHTAKAHSAKAYADLVDAAAHLVEGQVLFPDAAPMRRVTGGSLTDGEAELMTPPMPSGGKTPFSYVVKLRALTFPGLPAPVISVEYTRRAWVRSLDAKRGVKRLNSCFLFPHDSTRALRFSLQNETDRDGEKRYAFAKNFYPLWRAYYATDELSVQQVLAHGAQLPHPILIALKHGVGERGSVKAGIPDLDKLVAFRALRPLLAPLGLIAWRGLVPVETASKPVQDANHYWANREKDPQGFARGVQAELDELRACYPTPYHLVLGIGRDAGSAAEADQIQARLETFLPGGVVVSRLPIPAGAHGPLPPREQRPRAEERAYTKRELWAPFVEAVHAAEARAGAKADGILVVAAQWYGHRPDDPVSQRAARLALTGALGVPVQYLRPRADAESLSHVIEARRTAHVNAQDLSPAEREEKLRKTRTDFQEARETAFEARLMMAWRDLAFKSRGRVRKSRLDEELARQSSAPDRILGLGVARRNTTRLLANDPSILPYAFELEVATGLCRAAFAYEAPPGKEGVTWTEMLPLHEALASLARLGPTPLVGLKVEQRKREIAQRTQQFFAAQITGLAARSERPLVLCDATTSRSHWSWLQDGELNPEGITIAGNDHAQVTWPQVRMVRVRTDNSPKVLWEQVYSATTLTDGRDVQYEAPRWAEAQVFRLSEATAAVYLSFGSFVSKVTRGVSGYRAILGMKQGLKKPLMTELRKPHHDAWLTPQGLEVTVIRNGGAPAEEMVALVEWLRQCSAHYAGWTILPAPLSFASLFRAYLADYEIDEIEAEEAGPGETADPTGDETGEAGAEEERAETALERLQDVEEEDLA